MPPLKLKYNPYNSKPKDRSLETWKENKRIERIMAPLTASRQASTSTSSKSILTTLQSTSNPITHPLRNQGDHVDSCVTGHQRSDGRIPRVVIKSRTKKLREQRFEKGRNENGILAGTRIYIGGYLTGTTDQEIKRQVILEGGEVLTSAAGATHIVTSRGLSAAKTHKHLHTNRINVAHIVAPEWVTDSVSAKKRKREWEYRIVKDTFAHTIDDFKENEACPT